MTARAVILIRIGHLAKAQFQLPHTRMSSPRRGTKRRNGKGAATKRRRVDFSSPASMATATIARNLRTGGFLGIENKFVDYRVDDDAFTNVWAGGEMEDGTALSVSAVAQGVGESQRDGRKYSINSVFIRGTLEIPSSESEMTPRPDFVARVALVLDKQTNGAQLNAEDVFKTIGAAHDIDSFRNLQFVDRFQILAEKKIRIPQWGQTNEGAINLFSSPNSIVPFKMSFVFKKPLKVTTKATAAAIASIIDNSIHVIGTATSPTLTLSYTSRCRFTG